MNSTCVGNATCDNGASCVYSGVNTCYGGQSTCAGDSTKTCGAPAAQITYVNNPSPTGSIVIPPAILGSELMDLLREMHCEQHWSYRVPVAGACQTACDQAHQCRAGVYTVKSPPPS
jgi:hypothetical protein